MEKAEIIQSLVEFKEKLQKSKASAEDRAENLDLDIDKLDGAIKLLKGE